MNDHDRYRHLAANFAVNDPRVAALLAVDITLERLCRALEHLSGLPVPSDPSTLLADPDGPR